MIYMVNKVYQIFKLKDSYGKITKSIIYKSYIHPVKYGFKLGIKYWVQSYKANKVTIF